MARFSDQTDFSAELEFDRIANATCTRVTPRVSNKVRGNETVVFEYAPDGLADPDLFAIEPALALTRGGFAPPAEPAILGSIGDAAPDTRERRLMQRAERQAAEREGCAATRYGRACVRFPAGPRRGAIHCSRIPAGTPLQVRLDQ